MEPHTWIITILFVYSNMQPLSGAHSDHILLTDVKAMTLRDWEMTSYRRTSPVPQLKCIGGSAAGAFKPLAVQCINRGSDGYDVQWECKADMDNSYRFGQIEVTCEGYDYPEDPYILKGSCGLEYTLEFTEEGLARKNAQGNDKRASWNRNTSKTSFVKGLVFLLIIGVITYIIYKRCIAKPNRPPNIPHDNPPSYDEAVRSQNPHGNRQEPSAPPPPGFRPEYMPDTREYSCSSGAQPNAQTVPPPNFNEWNSSTKPSVTTKTVPPTASKTASTEASPVSSGTRTASGFACTARREYNSTAEPPETTKGSPSSATAPQSTGTRTASGFGGTKRR